MKTLNKILALFLMVAGVSVAGDVGAVNYIHEAVGIYGSDYTTNNTWTDLGTVNTGNTCTTTALSGKVTVTLSKGYIGSNAMTVYGKSNLKIQCSTGVNVYRVVISPADGEGTAEKNLSCNGTGSINQGTWWSSLDDGNNSVTFTGLDADNSFKIVHLNIYIKYEATAEQATITPTSITMSAQDADTYDFKLTTNESHTFDGSSTWFKNVIETSESSDNIDFDDYNLYGSYTNNSTLSARILAYNEGTYTADFCISYSTGNNNAHSYYAKALELTFTIIVTDACTKTPTVAFGTASPAVADYSAIPCSTTSFTRAATVKYNNVATGQTIIYRSSDEDVAEVSSAGVVTITGIGSARITASVQSDGDFCPAEAYYDITVTGYTVTLHYPACAAAVGGGTLTGTSKTFSDVCGAFSLNYDMSVDGYAFKGWSTSNSGTSPNSSSSITVSSNMDLYATYGEVSNDFQVNTTGTPMSAGDYVITGAYNGMYAPVMTTTYNSGKLSANTNEYSVTTSGKLQCKEETCIWTVAAVSGGFTIKNASTGKYLSSTSGDKSNSDFKLRLVDLPDSYSVWSFTSSSNNRYEVVNNKRNTDGDLGTKLMCNGNYFGFYTSNNIAPAFFKRTASSNTYTTNPSCDMDEVIVTIQNQSEGTAVASGTGGACVWDSPVLSKLYGTETITLTATPETGYQFTSWTVVSGGVTLSSTSTNPATFTMPTNNVVIRPNFGPETYDIVYKDKDDVTFSGTHATGYPTTHTYGTPTDLLTATKTGYVFMGWYDNSACTGSPVTQLGATAYTADITLYALFLQLTDPLAWCPEPTVTLTGDNVYVTGTYRENGAVMAVNQLTLNANNLIANGVVRLSTPAGSGVYFSTARDVNFTKESKPTATVDITADAGGDITDQTIYVHYLPSVAATAGVTATPQNVTVRAEYVSNNAYYSTQDVHVRNLPAEFVIATKVGTTWYALPADITSASNPAGVLIDVDETNWTCKGPAALAYSLWPVVTTNTANDQYQTYGEMIRLAGISNKALWTSDAASTYTINNSATISKLGSGADAANYRWAVAITEAGTTWKYTLTTAQTKNTNDLRYWQGKWGTYNSGGTSINEVYILPLITVEEANITVMEWAPTELALKCAANTELTGVTIGGEAVASPSLTSLGGDIYRLSGLPNLWNKKMQLMIIRVTEGGVAKQLTLKIPFIITDTQTAIDLRNFATGTSQDARNEVIRNIDVVVRNAGLLNVTTATGEATACIFNNLYIYPGGKVDISDNNINVRNVYLRGGFSWLDNKATFLLPQMKVANGRSIVGPGTSGNGIYYDFYGDFNMYYMLALPKDVAASALTNEENGDDWYANIKYYDGSERVLDPKGNKSWKWITGESTLTRGIGYEVAVKPRSAGIMNGRTIGILRFPLLTGAWANETDAAPSVTAHGKAGYEATPPTVTANNVGWNLMGNPFFSAFTNNGSNMYIYELVQHIENGHWTGTYDFNTEEGYKLKYFTIPNKTDYDYVDVRATDYKLEAFWPFFIQANATGSLTFASANRILRKPLMANNTLREVIIDFSLINGDKEDKAGLNISDNYSDKFDMEDKEKTLDNGIEFMKVYTLMDGYRIAFNSITEATAATLVPVGYIAPKQGEYTFTMPQTLNLSEVEAVYLTDFETGAVTDLVFADYTFTTAKGQFDERFALTVVLKAPHVATDITEQLTDGTSNLDGVKISSDEGVIILRGLPQGASLWVYDATGKLYDSQKGINGGRIVLPVKVAGAYNVHVKAQGESVTLKTVVR